ncbi:Coiled-coil domain-containing protein 12 [Orchesella cincta]|uniref:Coiled-coil domain-containing protein 12 n=1 Tax=Orchesella cincta TaxID=48709 RepID=A0A1D2N458_ORCCI|nr:Coiled-coil domain-containing protein 12 [Orchesella cincta]
MVVYTGPAQNMSEEIIPNFSVTDDLLSSKDKSDEVDDEPVGHLEEESKRRKDRLKALRQKLLGEQEEVGTKKIDAPLPKPVFRSYNPQDGDLQNAAMPKAAPIDIESHVADSLEQSSVTKLVEDVDLTNLAPRKPDWDLKRDVAPKLARLERRTQKAIAELILERLKNSQDLAVSVELSSDPRMRTVDDDE